MKNALRYEDIVRPDFSPNDDDLQSSEFYYHLREVAGKRVNYWKNFCVAFASIWVLNLVAFVIFSYSFLIYFGIAIPILLAFIYSLNNRSNWGLQRHHYFSFYLLAKAKEYRQYRENNPDEYESFNDEVKDLFHRVELLAGVGNPEKKLDSLDLFAKKANDKRKINIEI